MTQRVPGKDQPGFRNLTTQLFITWRLSPFYPSGRKNCWLTVDRTPARQPPHQSFTWSKEKDLYFSVTPTEGRIKIRFSKVWEMHINVDILYVPLSYSTTKGQMAILPRLENKIWFIWFQYFWFCTFLHSEGHVTVAVASVICWRHCGNKLQRTVASAPKQDENCPVRGKRAKQKMSTWTEVKVFVERSEFPFLPK